MSLNERDYMMQNRSDLVGRKNSRQKISAADKLVKDWRQVVFWFLVFSILIGVLKLHPQLPSDVVAAYHRYLPQQKTTIDVAGGVRWFIPIAADQENSAPLALIGLRDTGQNISAQISEWATRKPIVELVVPASETATVNLPLGKYRLTFSRDNSWRSGFLGDGMQEAITPIEIYRSDERIIGAEIDFNQRLGGNLATRRASLF